MREKGVKIPDRDLIIAAIAKRKKATVVTRDKNTLRNYQNLMLV